MPYYGAKFPFQIENGTISLTSTENTPELYVYSLIQSWFVEKGEAVFNFNHGVGLQRFTFKPLTEAYKRDMITALKSVTPSFEDRIIIKEIDVMTAEEAIDKLNLDESFRELPENTIYIGVVFIDKESVGKTYYTIFNSVGITLEVGVI